MTVRAELADGRVLEFPEGTDPGVIQQTVKRMLGATPAPIGTGRPKQTLSVEGGRKGSFLPLSTDPEGNLQFDLSAGITGAIGSALSLPGDVVTGKTDVYSPEAAERAIGLAMLATGAPPASRILRTPPRQVLPKAPTAAELKAAGSAGFEKARAMGVDYSSAAVKTMADDFQRGLEADGIIAELTPKTFAVLRKLQEPPEGSVASLAGLIAARRTFQNIALGSDATERLAAKRAIDKLDEFIAGPGQAGAMARPAATAEAVVPAGPIPSGGPAEEAARVLAEARGNYAAAKRSEKLTATEKLAADRAAASNSGKNSGNATRQRLASLLASDKAKRGYSKEELAFIQQVVDGKWGSEMARYAGNLMGGGGGLGQAGTGLGAAAFGLAVGGGPGAVAGAAVPVIGAASRALYNRAVKGQVAKLDEMIRQRSPLYQDLLKNAAEAPTSPEARAQLLRSLLLMLGVEEAAKP